MQRWTKTGVRTERVIVDGRAFDAPLLVMQSGEILPFVPQLSEEDFEGDSSGLRKRHEAAEAVLDAMHMLSTVRDACRELHLEKAGEEIARASLDLIFNATALYGASKREKEVHGLCVLISRQLGMGLLSLTMRRAVLRALKDGDSNIFYREFVCGSSRDKKGGRAQTVVQCVKHYKDEKRTRPSRGHVYEVIQAAGTMSFPRLTSGPNILGDAGERTKAVEFVPLASTSDALDDLCSGRPYGELEPGRRAARSTPFSYAWVPHVCCSLPVVEPPSSVCCETELHNFFVTMWQPWGIEEDSAFVTFGRLLLDGVALCERIHCYGLSRKAVHVVMEREAAV